MVPAPAVEGPGGSKLLRAGSQLSSAPTVATDMDFDGTPGPEQKHSQSSFGSLTDCDGTPSTQASASPTSFVCRPSQMLASFTNTFSTSSATSPRTEFSASHIERWGDKEETLIIFDWDDTLCPTTHGQENPECAEQDRAQLQAHEEVVARLLRVAGEVGHISIVSMAGTGWIERTLDNFMPGLKPLIAELNIPVTLAREGVPKRDKRQAFAEGREPSTYLKRRTMMKVVRNFYRTSIGNETKERSWKNVVSIGDSTAEKLALQDIVLARVQRDRKGRWKDCRCKTIKLKTEPTLAELSAQLCRVAESLPALVMHDGDLDMEFEEEEVQEAIAHYDLARHHVCADGPP